MVCISCIVILVVLWVWHKYLQPLFLRFWGPLPWGNKDAVTENKDSTKDPGKDSTTKGCPFSSKSANFSNGDVPNGHPPVGVEESSSVLEQKWWLDLIQRVKVWKKSPTTSWAKANKQEIIVLFKYCQRTLSISRDLRPKYATSFITIVSKHQIDLSICMNKRVIIKIFLCVDLQTKNQARDILHQGFSSLSTYNHFPVLETTFFKENRGGKKITVAFVITQLNSNSLCKRRNAVVVNNFK